MRPSLSLCGVCILLILGVFSCSKQKDPYGVETPPESYLHKEPSVPVIYVYTPYDQINRTCHEFAGDNSKFDVVGCGFVGKHACLVTLPEVDFWHGFSLARVNAIIEHEKYGHCNGLIHDKTGRGWYLNGKRVT